MNNNVKSVVALVTLIACLVIGWAMAEWLGLIIALVVWLVVLGSIGLTQDISDAGEAARQKMSKDQRED